MLLHKPYPPVYASLQKTHEPTVDPRADRRSADSRTRYALKPISQQASYLKDSSRYQHPSQDSVYRTSSLFPPRRVLSKIQRGIPQEGEPLQPSEPSPAALNRDVGACSLKDPPTARASGHPSLSPSDPPRRPAPTDAPVVLRAVSRTMRTGHVRLNVHDVRGASAVNSSDGIGRR